MSHPLRSSADKPCADSEGVARPAPLAIGIERIPLSTAPRGPDSRPPIPTGVEIRLAPAEWPAACAVAPGQVVVEIGCGPGRRAIATAQRVGPLGKVLGIDSSPAAVAAARKNARAAGLKNIEFYLCRMDSIPLPSAGAHWVIGGGISSLAGNRLVVFREILRALAPGGRTVIHDIAVRRLLPPEIANSVLDHTHGLDGVVEISSYMRLLSDLGLDELMIFEYDPAANLYDLCDGQPPFQNKNDFPAAGAAAWPIRSATHGVSLSHHGDPRRWLGEYLTGVRIEARKPA